MNTEMRSLLALQVTRKKQAHTACTLVLRMDNSFISRNTLKKYKKLPFKLLSDYYKEPHRIH